MLKLGACFADFLFVFKRPNELNLVTVTVTVALHFLLLPQIYCVCVSEVLFYNLKWIVNTQRIGEENNNRKPICPRERKNWSIFSFAFQDDWHQVAKTSAQNQIPLDVVK